MNPTSVRVACAANEAAEPAEFVKIAYSGPGFSDRNDGKHSFSEVEGASTGDMVGLVVRFRNETIYGEDVVAVRAVRAHLKLFDRNGKEIGTGFRCGSSRSGRS